jgi:Arc/MetJ-type ribon-helix-helix transcriptional regulator
MPRQTSVQLTEATERQAAELKALGFGSMTDVIRTAIDRMYQQETRIMNDLPKYFVPMNSEPAITTGRNATIGKIVGEDTDLQGMSYYLVSFGTDEPEIWYPGDGNIAYNKKQADGLVRFANQMDKEAA